MRYRTSQGRDFAPATRDILRLAHKVRCWRIAGWRVAWADELLVELDQLAARHPHHVRRVECLRSALMSSIVANI